MTVLPLVSCLMPTCDRRAFVPYAIDYFFRQDYPNKELVIVDDGRDPIADLVPADQAIRYIRLPEKTVLGAKRNLACEAARGSLLLHWDDDDWMAPRRIRCQVEALLEADAEICGLRQMLFHDPAAGVTWLYEYPANQRPWMAGGSLLYTRSFWQRSPFPSIQVGEDARFVWGQALNRAVFMPDYSFYVAMVHPGNTSPKRTQGAYWSVWPGDLRNLMGADLDRYPPAPSHAPAYAPAGAVAEGARHLGQPTAPTPTYAILMVVHNALEMVKLSTLRTLEHSSISPESTRGNPPESKEPARLVVVDNASTDGVQDWLALLARRGDIDLIRSEVNLGHGPALELARRSTRSPYLVALDSDAFPLQDGWLKLLRARMDQGAKAAGIRHHRDYIHPSCLMVARQTLDDWKLTFLDEKGTPSQFDVGERISQAIKEHGFPIAGLERTGALRRASQSEPVYLGSEYEGVVYHQWYTTRAEISSGRQVDDVPREAMRRSLEETLAAGQARPRPLTVVVGVRASSREPERLRNAMACLLALNLQTLDRWRYRIVVVEQDAAPHLEASLAPLADRYLFACNPGPYNRAWGFNLGAALPGSEGGLLCLVDADLLAPADFLQRALEDQAAGQRAILPYQEIIYLDGASSEAVIRDLHSAGLAQLFQASQSGRYAGQVYSTSVGGCLFVEAGLYRQLGGHDERFQGWGFEDNDFWRRLNRAAAVRRWLGRLLHLDHPRPAMDDGLAQANRRLYAARQAEIASAANNPLWEGQGRLDRYAPGVVSAAKPDGVSSTAGERPEVTASSGPIAPSPRSSSGAGRRPWEQWHRWSANRIEGILQAEEQLGPGRSARQKLADVLAGLGSSLLDVGCGPGALWLGLERLTPRLTWAGVDVTAEMLQIAHRKFASVPVQQADSAALPYASRSFDVVVLRHLLEHLPQDLMERTLEDALRVARRAVVVDFYVPPSPDPRPGGKSVRQMALVGEGFQETRWQAGEIQTPFERAGWWAEARGRLALSGVSAGETDELWIFTPRPLLIYPEPGRPRVSIIMATYRRPHTIFRTVQMVLSQTYRNWELIIVDNAGDGGYAFADPRIRVYPHAEINSASYARNVGLQYATGDLVCFFDDDDDMFPNYLERFVTAFELHPAARMARCGMLVSNDKVNFSYATPEICLRRPYATPTWTRSGQVQDQRYFWEIVQINGWSEANGTVVVVPEALCRANSNPQGGLRSGGY